MFTTKVRTENVTTVLANMFLKPEVSDSLQWKLVRVGRRTVGRFVGGSLRAAQSSHEAWIQLTCMTRMQLPSV